MVAEPPGVHRQHVGARLRLVHPRDVIPRPLLTHKPHFSLPGRTGEVAAGAVAVALAVVALQAVLRGGLGCCVVPIKGRLEVAEEEDVAFDL